MSRSVYSFNIIRDLTQKPVIAIEDHYRGGSAMTVTNNIENVVREVCKDQGLAAKDCLVVYRDTDGMWDAWDTAMDDFVILRERVLDTAIIKLLSIH